MGLSRDPESNMISLNHHGLGLPETPFAGGKESRYGSEGGRKRWWGHEKRLRPHKIRRPSMCAPRAGQSSRGVPTQTSTASSSRVLVQIGGIVDS
ncbi:hypothetical protein DF153_32765 [Burkholderia cenocepacia]|nr:hypothetical protein CFB49_28980 [Burkholderia sp. AU17457]OXI65574.1 hypothetical protein CFB81_28685 [Burkholderia sp. AU28863]RQU05675.1 hypothetical protein DF152_33815 [Burkholderia cenocepacia]RQU12573.1 hypothetical protein DF153_32765 [Burkholderia cenocepacia]